MTKEMQRVEEGGEDIRSNVIKGFPDGVGDGVRPRGGGGLVLCQCGGDLLCGESGAVCKGVEDRGE